MVRDIHADHNDPNSELRALWEQVYSFRVANQAVVTNVEMKTNPQGTRLLSAFNTERATIKFVLLDVGILVD